MDFTGFRIQFVHNMTDPSLKEKLQKYLMKPQVFQNVSWLTLYVTNLDLNQIMLHKLWLLLSCVGNVGELSNFS